MSERSLERAGWFAQHPLRNEEVHVVTREWFDEVAAENQRLRDALERIAALKTWDGYSLEDAHALASVVLMRPSGGDAK